MKAVNLQTEYLSNPMGIDITKPRFFWTCEGGVTQKAYEIVCQLDNMDIWTTGKVESRENTHIAYEGQKLKSRDRIQWKVRLWDEEDVAGEWSEASFEMGLLAPTDWQAKWICGDYKPKKNTRWPVGYFQKKFTISREVKSARLYATAAGLYAAECNGTPVGTICLAPGNTDNRVRIQYQTYDVSDLLKSGENYLNISLADGWYRGTAGAFAFMNIYGRMTKILAQLEINYTDGTKETITTDQTWEFSDDGPLRFADMKDGEICDATLTPSYRRTAKLAKPETAELTASNNVIPEKHEEFTPKLITTPSGAKVLDFGQNIAGFISFKVKGQKGQKVFLRMGEILDENGEFTQDNIQGDVPAVEVGMVGEIFTISGMPEKATKKLKKSPLQEVTFYCSGNEDTYETRFAVFGFRYALVETEIAIVPENFKAIAVYSSMRQTGQFSCSNEKVNQLVHNTLWSTKGNFLDVPTDCPTRERLGWTGDAQIFFNTGSYLMDSAAFYRKYLVDLWDAQTKDGKVPAVVPYNGGRMCYDNTGMSVGWADVVELLPYRYWKRYGDLEMLKDCYPSIKKYADYLLAHTGHKDKKAAKADSLNKYVYEKGMHLGEWLEPDEFKEVFSGGNAGNAVKVSKIEEATGYLCFAMTHLAEIARAVGAIEDARVYQEYAEGSRKAYEQMFLSPVPETNRQAKLVRPLMAHAMSPEKVPEVVNQLVKAAENKDYCVMTGFLSTPYLLPVLTENGRVDVAYKILENEKAPGWLSEVVAGATTIWESWEGDESNNHYSPGAVCEWLFNTVAGIQVDGVRHFTIAPIPGGTLTHAEASYDSLYGKVASSWKKEGDKTIYTISVPANTEVTLKLQGQETCQLTAGTYTYEV